MIAAAVLVIFPMCLAMAAFNDMLSMTIPNRLSLILVVAFMILAPFSGLSLQDIAYHFAAAGTLFAICFALFAIGIMGGGDAKILTASGLWLGFGNTLFEFVVYVSVFGGLLSLMNIMLRANSNLLAIARVPVPKTMLEARKVPYGMAIGAAALLVYPAAPIVKAVLGS